MRALLFCLTLLVTAAVNALDPPTGPLTDAKLEAFAAAALARDEPAMQRYIAEPGFARLVDKDGYSALFVAAFVGRADLAEQLVAGGADVNLSDPDQSTALFFAASNGHVAMVQWLIARGARIARTGSQAPLQVASMLGHTDVVRVLLEAGAPIFGGAPTTRSSDVLDIAVSAQRTEVLRLLLATDEARRMPADQVERLRELGVKLGDQALQQVIQQFQMSRSIKAKV